MQWIKATERQPKDWTGVVIRNGLGPKFVVSPWMVSINGIRTPPQFDSIWRWGDFEWLDETEWQPMDTAPKDGTLVLITEVTEEICIGFCKRGSWYYNNLTDEDGRYILITHPIGWQSLPRPMKND